MWMWMLVIDLLIDNREWSVGYSVISVVAVTCCNLIQIIVQISEDLLVMLVSLYVNQ